VSRLLRSDALPILLAMGFRDKLEATLRAVAPVLDLPGVLVGGSEVPNLLEPACASTLVVSQDVDLVVPITAQDAVADRMQAVTGLHPSAEEPSVWLPDDPKLLLEVNFIGQDPAILDPIDTYVAPSPRLPLLVFGPLSLLRPGRPVVMNDLTVPVPRAAGLILGKLLSDRGALKGTRDLLVVAGLLQHARDEDIDEAVATYGALADDLRYTIRANLVVLSLLEGLPDMPDPRAQRERVHRLLTRLEAQESGQ